MIAKLLLATMCGLIANGCAQAARELPPDMSRVAPHERLQAEDKSDPAFMLPCAEIQDVISSIRQERARHETLVVDSRVRNQAVVYTGLVLFPPALLFMDPNLAEHEKIRSLEERLDRLDRIRVAKGC